MKYFDKYTSNTIAGSGNQFYFTMKDNEIKTGRIFYKIATAGCFDYSILFSNVIDSTYADGAASHCNLMCDEWKIHSAKLGKCKHIPCFENTVTPDNSEEFEDIEFTSLNDILFNGKKEKHIMPGEFFSSDPIEMNFDKGDYLCLEITFSGTMIPYHEESLLPVFIKQNNKWIYSKLMPFPAMIGCSKTVKKRIAFLGDSITQGIGTAVNSYKHWNSILAQKLGDEYSYWNLGLGHARAYDASSDGAWLFKAKQNDIIFLCLGVNDIMTNRSEQQIKADIFQIVRILKKCGKKVVIQTIPPFNYEGEAIYKWKNINGYIKNEISSLVDFVYDNNYILGENTQNLHKSKYGAHPNEDGCYLWAEDFYKQIKSFMETENI